MARTIHYEDLALGIERDGPRRFQVRTLSSPYGLAAACFDLSLSRSDLEELIAAAAADLFRRPPAEARPPARDLVRLSAARRRFPAGYRETGARLFRALFHEDVRENYLLSRGRSEALPDRGLRIRLVLPAESGDLALLQALPWELLYCEETGDFLARNVLTPLVRQLAIPKVSSALSADGGGGVRILVAVANPEGSVPLAEADERARIVAACARQRGAEVRLLRATTLTGLYEAVRSEHFQVVHFIAHGDFDAEAGEGHLLLETAERRPFAVPGPVLAETLRASRELRLVFLNSCETARQAHLPGQDPLLGTAAALVRRGVPAVLAMQFPISDPVALTFSEAVYRSLMRGSALDAAVADGRLALYQADPDSWEWITPVLLTALSEASLLRPLCAAAEDRITRREETLARAAALLGAGDYAAARRLLELSLDGAAESADLHYYLALALLGGRRPKYLKVAEAQEIEGHARRALSLADCAAHHVCLLALLRRDFYLENHLVSPEPRFEELLARAAAAPILADKLGELALLAPGAREVMSLVAARPGSDAR